jgi:acetyltransferase-like isoleucine patch superfamily enzyme
MLLFRLLKYFFSIHKYQRYFVDNIYVPRFMTFIWRRQGISFKNDIIWYGVPVITVVPNSTISIGNMCTICSRTTQTALGVNHPSVLRTLRVGAELRIGDGVRMSGTTICAANRVLIGDRCVIGANVTIIDTDFHSLDKSIRSSPEDFRLSKDKAVEIGCDVFIGGGSYILKGVKIGDGAVIGAASVVTGDVGVGIFVAGNPAREISRCGISI